MIARAEKRPIIGNRKEKKLQEAVLRPQIIAYKDKMRGASHMLSAGQVVPKFLSCQRSPELFGSAMLPEYGKKYLNHTGYTVVVLAIDLPAPTG